MELLNRVHVYSSNGRWLARVPARRARELLSRQATVDEQRSGKVTGIRLFESPLPSGPSTPLTPASYQGQRYVFEAEIRNGQEIVGHCFKHSDDILANRDVFVQVIADVCTVK